MPSFRQTMLLLASAALAAPLATSPALAQAATQAAPQSEDARLTALFAADDEASLKRNPLNGLFRGDTRYADRLGDYVTDAYFDGERKAAEDNLAALARIGLSRTSKKGYKAPIATGIRTTL